jgi:hypothetical protein
MGIRLLGGTTAQLVRNRNGRYATFCPECKLCARAATRTQVEAGTTSAAPRGERLLVIAPCASDIRILGGRCRSAPRFRAQFQSVHTAVLQTKLGARNIRLNRGCESRRTTRVALGSSPLALRERPYQMVVISVQAILGDVLSRASSPLQIHLNRLTVPGFFPRAAGWHDGNIRRGSSSNRGQLPHATIGGTCRVRSDYGKDNFHHPAAS